MPCYSLQRSWKNISFGAEITFVQTSIMRYDVRIKISAMDIALSNNPSTVEFYVEIIVKINCESHS